MIEFTTGTMTGALIVMAWGRTNNISEVDEIEMLEACEFFLTEGDENGQ